MSTSGTSSPEHKGVPPGDLHNASAPGQRTPRSRRTVILGSITAVIVVLALALGLGLGLGLRHHHDNSSSSASSGTSSSDDGNGIPSSLATVGTPDSSAAFLSADIINDAPTTRTYQFVVAEGRGAPDGVEKRMIVVNGRRLCILKHHEMHIK